jgi:plastocyanin
MTTGRFLAVGALVAGVALAACGGDDGGGGGGDDADSSGASPTVAGATEFEVTASNFAFEPEALEIGAGEDFTVTLEATDGPHDFVIEGGDGFVGAGLGETASGGFKVDDPGEYTFYCSIGSHRAQGMEGVLSVT